jgi:hypothetical protein
MTMFVSELVAKLQACKADAFVSVHHSGKGLVIEGPPETFDFVYPDGEVQRTSQASLLIIRVP